MGIVANDVVKAANGTEFGLRWGTGYVKSVTENKVNATIVFANPRYKHPFSGSVDQREQKALFEMLKSAKGDEGAYFAFRLESHRDHKVPKETPYDELRKDDNNNNLLHVRIAAAFSIDTPEAKALIEQCEVEAAGGMAGSSPEVAAVLTGNGSRHVENQPADNQLPGESWEFAASMGCVDLAFETFIKLDRKITQADLEALGAQFLRIADNAQTALSGRLVRSGRAHTRARGAMRTVLERYPLPNTVPGADQMTIEEHADLKQRMVADWEEKVTKITISLLKAGEAILARK